MGRAKKKRGGKDQRKKNEAYRFSRGEKRSQKSKQTKGLIVTGAE